MDVNTAEYAEMDLSGWTLRVNGSLCIRFLNIFQRNELSPYASKQLYVFSVKWPMAALFTFLELCVHASALCS